LRILSTQSIQRQVLVSSGVLLLLIGLGAAWSVNRTRLERRAEVHAEAASVVATSVAYFDWYLRGLDSMASVLVRHPSVVAPNTAGCDRLFADVLRDRPLMLNVVLRAPDGTLRCSGLQARDISLGAMDQHVEQVVSSGRQVVSGLTIGPVTHKPTVVMAYPVEGDRSPQHPDSRPPVVGVIDFEINLPGLQTLFAGIPLPEGSVITLTDRRGLVLARSRDADRFIGTTMEVSPPTSPGAVPRLSAGTDIDGIDRLFASAAVERGAWVMTVGIPRSAVGARLWPLWRRILIVVFIAVSISCFLSWWIGRRLSRQLKDLRAASDRIAQGDLSPPAAVAGPLNQELGALQDAFVAMAENLRQMRETLGRQVDQERQMREALESLQRQVVRQERVAAVGVLVSGVAHELNNPLQAIFGSAELLERRPDISGGALLEIGFIKTQSARAREIIRNLSRFTSQHSGPPAAVDLHDVIAAAIELRRATLDAAEISLEVETRSTRKVLANFTELEQVVLNFVINAQQAIQAIQAIQAGDPRPGRIVIRLLDVGKRVRLEVTDNGAGVSSNDEPKLFQPFFTTKPVGQGTGLGLSVSYGIVEAYGGTVGYHGSESGGATFFFDLPALDQERV
jgi:signal transduction histidine kinase